MYIYNAVISSIYLYFIAYPIHPIFLIRAGDVVDVWKWYDLFNRKNDKDVRDICNTRVSKIYLLPLISGFEG